MILTACGGIILPVLNSYIFLKTIRASLNLSFEIKNLGVSGKKYNIIRLNKLGKLHTKMKVLHGVKF